MIRHGTKLPRSRPRQLQQLSSRGSFRRAYCVLVPLIRTTRRCGRLTPSQNGVYVGRILKGAKPADLPVVQGPSLNWSSTIRPRMLDLTVPPALLATADEVIE